MSLIQPKQVQIKTQEGVEKTYTLSKFDAISGREILTQYPISAIPKLGDYKTNKEMMLKILSFVEVTTDAGTQQRLTTEALIQSHVPDWETLARIEAGMVEYNCSFFGNGRASTFFEGIAQKVPALITKMLTDLSAQSSRKDAPPSTN